MKITLPIVQIIFQNFGQLEIGREWAIFKIFGSYSTLFGVSVFNCLISLALFVPKNGHPQWLLHTPHSQSTCTAAKMPHKDFKICLSCCPSSEWGLCFICGPVAYLSNCRLWRSLLELYNSLIGLYLWCYILSSRPRASPYKNLM